MYDIIGDIHGYAERAKALLRMLGYRERGGVFSHPERKALFLGDLIDRGPEQAETVNLVRRMVDAGNAIAVMGNHEYNAVAYSIEDPRHPGEFLRKHSSRNRHQHQAFLDQVGENTQLYREMIAWFKTMPLYHDQGIRAIHACWHAERLDEIQSLLNPDLSIREDSWVPMNTKGTAEYHAVETVLKGPEIDLPHGLSYHDKDGIERVKTRTCWWHENPKTYRDIGHVPPSLKDQLPCEQIDECLIHKYDNTKPVFVGHYWMTGTPSRLAPKIACLDYSIGKGGSNSKLCAYRWDGENSIDNDKFVWVSGIAHQKTHHSSLEPH